MLQRELERWIIGCPSDAYKTILESSYECTTDREFLCPVMGHCHWVEIKIVYVLLWLKCINLKDFFEEILVGYIFLGELLLMLMQSYSALK